MSELYNIPKHWQVKKLGEVAKWGSGGTPTSSNPRYYNGDIPWLIIGDLNDGYVSQSRKKITKLGLKNSSAKLVKPDSVLIAMYGSIGKLGINKILLATNQAIAFTEKLNPDIFNKYLFHYLFHIRNKLHSLGKGGTQNNISQTVLKQVDFPFPPLPEQLAIVSKIEELLSDLENGKQQLLTAQQQLKVYRQSLLKAAFEGRLTNNDVKDGELPEGWNWVKLKDVSNEISDGDHQAPPKSNEGIPFITISNVNKNTIRIDFSETFKVDVIYYSNLKYNRKPQKGDVLYTVTGSYGIPILIDFDKEFCFQRHIGLIRPKEIINQKWLYYLLQSPYIYNQAKSAATGTTQKTVALSSLRNFEIPYCPLSEQHQIVEILESKLTICDKIAETISQSLQQVETLKQSILKKAFEGRLV